MVGGQSRSGPLSNPQKKASAFADGQRRGNQMLSS